MRAVRLNPDKYGWYVTARIRNDGTLTIEKKPLNRPLIHNSHFISMTGNETKELAKWLNKALKSAVSSEENSNDEKEGETKETI